MGQNVHCTVHDRIQIQTLCSEGKSHHTIAEIVGCSKMVENVLIKYRKTKENRGDK